jgi:hypothetical protein
MTRNKTRGGTSPLAWISTDENVPKLSRGRSGHGTS